MRKITPILFLMFLLASFGYSQSLTEFEKKVTQFKLDNGLTFIVVERHEVPVVSFFTYANVGSVDEAAGQSGLAHMFEHMAFKGTTTIGTKDIVKEREAMKKEDEAFLKLRIEKAKGKDANPDLVKQDQKEFDDAVEAAKQYVVTNEFGDVIDRAGAVGLNANTESDSTKYYYDLPSNKIELWFSLESDRFLNPVLREFYTEKNVVMEERRLRIDSQPIGKLFEDFMATAYKAHPYGVAGIGWMSDLQWFGRPEAEAFFKKYYGPNNLTMVIVGDVDPNQAKQLARTYFGRLSAAPPSPPVHTVEPPQTGERRILVEAQSQPIIFIGYHKGTVNDPDEQAAEALADIVGRGRSCRLYKDLVKDKKIAIQVGVISDVPGGKYPDMIVFYAVPSQNHTNEECEKVLLDEMERLKKEPVTEAELRGGKNRARADLIRQLRDNDGIAEQVAEYQGLTGDWRNLFRELDKINALTAADIQKVATQYLTENNRTVADLKQAQ